MSPITTHVLDTSVGRPAMGVPVHLDLRFGDSWQKIGSGQTDDDGRVTDLVGAGDLQAGHYRLTFDTGNYFSAQDVESFYPVVRIEFVIRSSDQHYHVPLLLNPFGYTTYRGS